METGDSTELLCITSLNEAVIEVYDEIQSARLHLFPATGIWTGFSELDRMTGGFYAGELILLSAHPAMGKTAFALSIVENVAVKKDKTCLLFSPKVSKRRIAKRLISMVSGVDIWDIERGTIDYKEDDRIIHAVDVVSNNLLIDDSSCITLEDIRSKAHRLHSQNKLDLIIIDSLEGIKLKNANNSHTQELSLMLSELKSLAVDLDLPIMILSTLPRYAGYRKNRRPAFSDLRDASAVGIYVDLVMFLYRDEYYHSNSKQRGMAELIIAKQHHGPTGMVRLHYLSETLRFVTWYDSRQNNFEADQIDFDSWE